MDGIPEELLVAKRAAVQTFLSARREVVEFTALAASTVPRQNVVGVGIGRRITRGRAKSAHTVRLYVEHKVSPDAIPADFLLPKEIEGVPTDVIEAGRFEVLAKAPAGKKRAGKSLAAGGTCSCRSKLRPAQPGCSVGFQYIGPKAGFVMAGTFGAVVADAQGEEYILSNNHVLADENGLELGSPIFQPGLLDGGNPATDQIAVLSRFITLQTSSPNQVDAAIAKQMSAGLLDAKVLPKVGQLRSRTPVAAAEKMQVHKVGRTTCYTRGEIYDVSADVTVKYGLGMLTFQDQMLIRGEKGGAFSAAGDSGSLIVDRRTGRPTGLLFAGSDKFTIANHIATVLTQLNVTIKVK